MSQDCGNVQRALIETARWLLLSFRETEGTKVLLASKGKGWVESHCRSIRTHNVNVTTCSCLICRHIRECPVKQESLEKMWVTCSWSGFRLWFAECSRTLYTVLLFIHLRSSKQCNITLIKVRWHYSMITNVHSDPFVFWQWHNLNCSCPCKSTRIDLERNHQYVIELSTLIQGL